MRRVNQGWAAAIAAAAVAAATVLATTPAEARPKFRGFTSAKPAAPAPKPERGGTSVLVAPGLGGAGVAAAAAATGSVAAAPAPKPTAVVERPAPKPRDPCAADKLFGAGVGFCAVN